MTHVIIDRPPPATEPVTVKPKPPRDEVTSFWPFLWTLFAFKFVTLVATWWFAFRSPGTTLILSMTHWFWLFIPMIAVSGPFLYQWRLRRVRRRRAQLQASEWMVDELR